jgi:O-antigen/teichoic acid export membrane protein
VATQDRSRLFELSTLTNRYSLTLFLPLAIFLSVYGPPLLAVWINPQFGANASGVLLALLAGITIAHAGQCNSASILFGMGRHQAYARALLMEAVLVVAGVAIVVKPYGIVGAACVVSGMMLLNRGAFTSWLLSRELKTSYLGFLAHVYQPLLTAVPVIAILAVLRATVLPGRNWPQLILAGTVMLGCYLPLALWGLRPEHRALLFGKLRERFL